MARSFFQMLRAAETAGAFVSDAELLRRHISKRDSAAIELLVRRHADAVWAVCSRVSSNHADAQDAFQSAFLLLLRHAGSIRGTCAGGWLHRVALNACLKLKQRKRTPELRTSDEPADRDGLPEERAESRERAALVHQELARLPERYRLPVVLCDLDGHTHSEAAAILNWPVGSVSGRLSRAHAILRERLSRRGLAPAAILAAFTSASPSASAVQLSLATLAGAVPISHSVSSLVQGVTSAMRAAKLKLALVVASYGVAALAGVASVVAWSGADTPVLTAEPAPIAAAPAPPEPPIEGNWLSEEVPTAFPNIKPLDLKNADPDSKVRLAKQYPRLFAEGALAIQPADDTYRRLLKARLHQGAREVVRRQVLIERGAFLPSEFPIGIAVLEDMRATALELWPRDEKELIPRLEEFVGLAKDFTQFIQARVKAGTDPVRHMNMAERHRLKAEADLWKALHPK